MSEAVGLRNVKASASPTAKRFSAISVLRHLPRLRHSLGIIRSSSMLYWRVGRGAP
jgi:hypothetical protein